MAEAHSATLFVIDTGSSMAEERTYKGKTMPKLTRAMEYVNYKLQNMIDRGLKTANVGFTLFGASKTDNILTDADKDGYDWIREYINVDPSDLKMVDKLKKVRPSENQTDILSALLCGMAILSTAVAKSKKKKNIILITDGETPTEWGEEDVQTTVDQLVKMQMELTIVGVDFDDDIMGFKEEDKSESKQINESHLAEMAKNMKIPAVMGNLERAILQASGPQVKIVSSRNESSIFTIGDRDDPECLLSFPIHHKKATSKASAKAAKRLSTKDLPKGKRIKGIIDPSRGGKVKSSADPDHYGLSKFPSQSALQASFEAFLSTHSSMPAQDSQFNTEETQSQFSHSIMNQSMNQTVDTSMDMDDGVSLNGDADDVEVHRTFLRYYIPQTIPGQLKPTEAEITKQTNAELKRRLLNPARDEDEDGNRLKKVAQDAKTTKAYKYGGTRVPMEQVDENALTMQKDPGFEMVASMPASKLPRNMVMGDSQYIWGKGPKGELFFSAFVTALLQKDYVAIVRYVSARGSNAIKMGAFLPRREIANSKEDEDDDSPPKETQYCVFVQLPFSEDWRKQLFPSLTNLKTRSGKDLTEHKQLPTENQLLSMSDFVDTMDLEEVQDEEGQDQLGPWFECYDSYNPAIHNVAAAVQYRRNHPDDTALPPPHPEITKYAATPEIVLERAQESTETLIKAMELKRVPPKVTRGKKNVRQDDNEGEINFDDFGGLEGFGDGDGFRDEEDIPMYAATRKEEPTSSKRKASDEDSGDETLSEEEPAGPVHRPPKAAKMEVDQKAPATKRGFIGTENPLEDYERLVESKGSRMLKEGIRDMLLVIGKMLGLHGPEAAKASNFGGSRTGLAVQCLHRVRRSALEEEEADQYNDFLKQLKAMRSESPKMEQFWRKHILAAESPLGLIPNTETYGDGASEEEAAAFLED